MLEYPHLMDEDLGEAVNLRKAGKLQESLALLLELVERRPDNAQVHYQCAWSHDVLGKETEAIPFYERAIKLGLQGQDLEGALIGLGSSARCVGELAKGEEVLRRACREFPSSRAAQVFLSMTLYNSGNHAEAMEILLRNLGETSSDESIRQYKLAILNYAGDLEPNAVR